jgi:hypothetical protein
MASLRHDRARLSHFRIGEGAASIFVRSTSGSGTVLFVDQNRSGPSVPRRASSMKAAAAFAE